MVDLVVLQSVSYVAAAIGVCIAAVYYVMTLRVQQTNMKQTLETRQAQMFMQLFNQYISADLNSKMIEIRRIEWSKPEELRENIEKSPDLLRSYTEIEMYNEGLGILMKKGLMDPEFIEDFMGSDLIYYWERMYPLTKLLRETDWPNLGEFHEYLYHEMKRIFALHHPELSN